MLGETDIRGGQLKAGLGDAARGAGYPVVCYSPAASESRWVADQVRLFPDRGEANRIAVAGGHASPDVVGRASVPDAELRVHDRRRSRLLAPVGLGVKLELLRLLALVADVDTRVLRNGRLRRTVASIAVTVAVAVLPPWALLHFALDERERVT